MACTAAVERTVHGHLIEQALLLDGIDPELAALIRSIQVEEDEHLAYAEARHDPATPFAKVVSAIVSGATAALIALSTRGDSLRLARLA
jgi:ubiquinone biosynthesis monooxygenase Coq7